MDQAANLERYALVQRMPTWAIVAATAIALYGGLAIVGHLVPDAHAHKPFTLPPLSRVFTIGIPAYVLEALVFTVVPIELATRYLHKPLFGAAAGVLGYGVLYHWSHGLPGIVLASWIALVLNTSYLVLRDRSVNTAIIATLGQKIGFLLLAVLAIYILVKPH